MRLYHSWFGRPAQWRVAVINRLYCGFLHIGWTLSQYYGGNREFVVTIFDGSTGQQHRLPRKAERPWSGHASPLRSEFRQN